MGFPLYGNDLDETITPLQAGLGWVTKLIDEKPLLGKEVLLREKAAGVSRKLCGFELQEKGIPRHGYEILNASGEQIGTVTSGTMSPVLKQGIGMGYVKPEYAQPGSIVLIQIRNKQLPATVVKMPFRH
jgi:aminomethyltransferase